MPFIALPCNVELWVDLLPASPFRHAGPSSSSERLGGAPTSSGASNLTQRLESITLSASSAAPATRSTSCSETRCFDPSKPILLVISPIFSLSASLIPQVRDSRIRESFNIVAVDLRSQGRSKGDVRSSYDHWTAAADMATVMSVLQLPPCHVWAPSSPSFQTALNLAILFPELVLSLSFAGVSALSASPKALPEFLDLETSWHSPLDPEEFEDALGGLKHSFFSEWDGVNSLSIIDTAMSVISRRYNPKKAVRAYEMCRPNHHVPQPSPLGPASIRVPVLMIHGSNDLVQSLDEAIAARQGLKGTMVDFHEIAGAPHLLYLTHAEEVTSLLWAFLSRQLTLESSGKGVVTASSPSAPVHFQRALATIAKLSDNPRMRTRDFRNPDSFSLVSSVAKDYSTRQLDRLQKRARLVGFAVPGMTDAEPWEERTSQRRPWRWSQRHIDGSSPSQRASLAREISVAIELATREEERVTDEDEIGFGSDGTDSSEMMQTPEAQVTSPIFDASFMPVQRAGMEGSMEGTRSTAAGRA